MAPNFGPEKASSSGRGQYDSDMFHSSGTNNNSRSTFTDREPNPKRRKVSNTNARFDQMVETMSTIHTASSKKDGHANTTRFQRRFLRGDAYSPPRLRNHPQDLSFIKLSKPTFAQGNLQEERPSSEGSKISNNSFSRRSCDPLPTWLASTFMGLSRKHPLRLLLPPGLIQVNPDEDTNELVSTYSGAVIAQSEPMFAPNLPSGPRISRPGGPPPQQFTYTESETFVGSTTAIERTLSSPPSPFFSTPGPVYMLKDNPAPNASIPSPTSCSSSTPYSANIRVGLDSSVPDSFVPNYCSDNEDSTLFGVYDDNTDDSASDPLPHELANNHLFLDIFATPGPGYCASRIEHFDSPTEDPSKSSGKNYEDIDFRWKPFDRKELVVPPVPERISFAYARSEKHEGEVKDLINSINFLKTQQDRASNVSSSPTSPNPFRFMVPAEDDPFSTSPESQAQLRHLTAQQPPFVSVPGIYLPQLAPTLSDPSARLTLPETGSAIENGWNSSNRHKENSLRTVINPVNEIHSQKSDDSIQSWGIGD